MTQKNSPVRPVMLTILDGWGYRVETEYNAVAAAHTPNLDALRVSCPTALIEASGKAVGLPDGQMGNSEVGHMNIGAGRVMMQDLPKIDKAVKTGELAAHPLVQETMKVLKETGGAMHLLGLFSDGGVHAHIDHIAALAEIFSGAGIQVFVHGFLDGRDVPPQSAVAYVSQWETCFSEQPKVSLATLCGRYYAMDRDTRWDRVELAYRAMVEGTPADEEGFYAAASTAIEASYAANVTDEFVRPTVMEGYAGMKDGDAVLMANFRADRAREMMTAIGDHGFGKFARSRENYTRPALAKLVGMVNYSTDIDHYVETIYPAEQPKNTLGETLELLGKTQLHIAETEKYAHVTFFFNGGREEEFDGETRILVQSPDVATYDLKPEMSAYEVTDKLVEAIQSGAYDFIVVNYANTDMVGHTGSMEAATKAVEALDVCIGRVNEALKKAGGAMLITADHGNAEQMYDPESGQPHTAHTLNKVPLILAHHGAEASTKLADGCLADLAPTVLRLMGVEQPEEMTGKALVA